MVYVSNRGLRLESGTSTISALKTTIYGDFDKGANIEATDYVFVQVPEPTEFLHYITTVNYINYINLPRSVYS